MGSHAASASLGTKGGKVGSERGDSCSGGWPHELLHARSLLSHAALLPTATTYVWFLPQPAYSRGSSTAASHLERLKGARVSVRALAQPHGCTLAAGMRPRGCVVPPGVWRPLECVQGHRQPVGARLGSKPLYGGRGPRAQGGPKNPRRSVKYQRAARTGRDAPTCRPPRPPPQTLTPPPPPPPPPPPGSPGHPRAADAAPAAPEPAPPRGRRR